MIQCSSALVALCYLQYADTTNQDTELLTKMPFVEHNATRFIRYATNKII